MVKACVAHHSAHDKASRRNTPACPTQQVTRWIVQHLRQRKTDIRNRGTQRELSLKVDTMRRCPDRKLSLRRMTQEAKAQSNI
jgi:hypothetical protein